MKRLLAVFLIIFAASHSGITQVFAQKKANTREVIVIEFLAPNMEAFAKQEIPINKNPDVRNGIGGTRIDECFDYKDEECSKLPDASYEFSAIAGTVDKNKSRVDFKIEVADGCKTRWIFTIYRSRQTKAKLKCGVSLIAYYGLESEEKF